MSDVLELPAHVSPDIVVDIDVYDIPGGNDDPQLAWRSFQGKGPLVYSPRNGGHWIAASGDAVFKFYRDNKTFSSSTVGIGVPEDAVMLPINADPPVHAEYRRNVIGMFTPEAVGHLSAGVRDLTVELIEGFRDRGECEFVSEFSLVLPLTIFLQMVELPLEDRMMLRDWVQTYANDPVLANKIVAQRQIHDYLADWVDKRAADPGSDAISRVTRATIHGRPYTRDEMVATIVLLLHAGLDTVANFLSFTARHLALHPEQRDYIRANFDKMQDITQELLRRFAVANLARRLTTDYEYQGITMKKGEMVILPNSLFNLDPAVAENPEEVDLTRKSRHVTFGAGAHTCAGALLARKEIQIFLEEWLTRIPDFALDPARPPHMAALPTNTCYELWLTWPKPATP